MASAWGVAFGSAWGNSWGTIGPPPEPPPNGFVKYRYLGTPSDREMRKGLDRWQDARRRKKRNDALRLLLLMELF